MDPFTLAMLEILACVAFGAGGVFAVVVWILRTEKTPGSAGGEVAQKAVMPLERQ